MFTVLAALFLALRMAEGHYGEGGSCYPGSTKPHPDDCAMFYKCSSSGNPVLYKCPSGAVYSERTQTCEWGTCSPKKTSCFSGEYAGKSKAPNPQDPTTYYTCNQGKPCLQKCPSGDVYDAKMESCVCRTPPSSRSMDCSSEDPKGFPRTYQNPKDCGTFYTCNQGRPVLTYCPRNMFFNPRRGGCEDKVSPGCTVVRKNPSYSVHEETD